MSMIIEYNKNCLKAAVQSWKDKPTPLAAVQLRSAFDIYAWQLPKTGSIRNNHVDYMLAMFCEVTPLMIEENGRYLPEVAQSVLKHLADKDSFANLSEIPESRNLIAWFLCAHIDYFTRDTKTPHPQKLNHVVAALTGRALSNKKRATVKDIVTMLHGEMCWQFYGCDQADETDEAWAKRVSNELYHAGISVLAPRSAPSENSASLVIPSSMLTS